MAPSTLAPNRQATTATHQHHTSPRRRDGTPKRRTSWNEKMRTLDTTAPAELTERRLAQFQRLFAFRRSGGIVTRAGQGPRAWTKLKGTIGLDHIARHLLADRIPNLAPQWVGARSLETSLYLCLDVDPDRTPEQHLDDNYNLAHADDNDRQSLLATLLAKQRGQPTRPTFEARCQTVEAVLRRLGINPANPRQVLTQRSPSGGRHYYAFFDQPYDLYQYKAVLESAGLRFAKGQIELFPATNAGLRLPFGHLPDHHRDPREWIKFVDSYYYNRIKKHTLAELYEHLESWQAIQRAIAQRKPTETANHHPSPTTTTPTHSHGTPRRRQPTNTTITTSTGIPWTPTNGAAANDSQPTPLKPKTTADAQQLFGEGIQQPGTRTEVLKHLAAHLIFIKGQSADASTKTLTTWAMNPRHQSKDIQADLAHGTDVVPRHIQRLCQWYANHRDPTRHPAQTNGPTSPVTNTNSEANTTRYAPAELAALQPHLELLPPDERHHTAIFYLHFLAYAKQHGQPAPNGTGWDAAPAVNAVLRRWPGCHHLNYKRRIEAAKATGLLRLIKDKWQNPHGKGRARTYRIAVPITPSTEWVLNYDEALAQLTSPSFGATGEETAPQHRSEPNRPALDQKEPTNAPHQHTSATEPADQHDRNEQPNKQPHQRTHPPAVHPARTRVDLAQAPRQCQPQPTPARRLRRQAAAGLRTRPTIVLAKRKPNARTRSISRRGSPRTSLRNTTHNTWVPIPSARSPRRPKPHTCRPRSPPDRLSRGANIGIERARADEY